MKNKATVIIYTHNEEKNIKDCINSARRLTNDIIVIDSQSTDKTIEIVKKEGVSFYSCPYRLYVESAREFGIQKAKSDWVFILDADERVTKELAREITETIRSQDYVKSINLIKKQFPDANQVRVPLNNIAISHYKIPRKNIFGNKWLKHGGWWPDYQIRLINKKFLKNWPKQIHSTPKIEGGMGYLKNPLVHYFHGDLDTMVKKTIVFENLEADLLFQAHRSVSTCIFFRKFLGEFYRRTLKNLGFLDGEIGIIEGIYQAFSKTITYLFLYEKKIKSGSL